MDWNEWKTLHPQLLQTINHLSLFPFVLIELVVSYCRPRYINPDSRLHWKLPNDSIPLSLHFDGKQLIIRDQSEQKCYSYNLINENFTLFSPPLSSSKDTPIDYDIFQTINNQLLCIWFWNSLKILYVPKNEVIWELAIGDLFSYILNNNIIYLTRYDGQEIQCYQLGSITMYKSFGDAGNAELGLFESPRGLAFNNEKNLLFICDNGNHRIQVFDLQKEAFIYAWGQHGKYGLRHPWSILISDDNSVFVGDLYNIKIYNLKGNLIQRIGKITRGSKEGQLDIIGTMIIIDNRLYVGEKANKRITVFEFGDENFIPKQLPNGKEEINRKRKR